MPITEEGSAATRRPDPLLQEIDTRPKGQASNCACLRRHLLESRMREIRTSGSSRGGAILNPPPTLRAQIGVGVAPGGRPHFRHSLRRRMRHEQLMPLAATRNQRKTTAATDSSIGWLHPEARIPRTRQSTVGRDLVDWNRGMGDAESGRLAASGRSRDYYDGYYY